MIDCTEILPVATLERVAPIVEDFRARGVSGQVTVVLHFCDGQAMPSEVGTHERHVGRKKVDPDRLRRSPLDSKG